MEILVNKRKLWEKIIICPDCKSKLKIQEADLNVGNAAIMYAGETWEPYLYVRCGVCRSNIEVKGVPVGLKNRLFSCAERTRAKIVHP